MISKWMVTALVLPAAALMMGLSAPAVAKDGDRADRRAERRAERQEFRADTRQHRQEFRADRRQDRQEFRAERRQDRQDFRKHRRYDRKEFRTDRRDYPRKKARVHYDRRHHGWHLGYARAYGKHRNAWDRRADGLEQRAYHYDRGAKRLYEKGRYRAARRLDRKADRLERRATRYEHLGARYDRRHRRYRYGD